MWPNIVVSRFEYIIAWAWDAVLARTVLRSLHEVMEAPTVSVTTTELNYQAGLPPTDAELLDEAGATTDVGTLTVDSHLVKTAGLDNGSAEVSLGGLHGIHKIKVVYPTPRRWRAAATRWR